MLKKEVRQESFDMLWLENLVEILNKDITGGVLIDDENKIVQKFKIRQFYLSTLLKFATNFNRKYFRGHKFVINGILYLNSLQYETNISIVRKKEINILKLKYLEVLYSICESDEFFKVLQDYLMVNEVKELTSLLFICEAISKNMISEGSKNGIYLIKIVFKILSKSSKILINESEYNELVETIAVLIMKNHDFKMCEKILFETFLDNNYMTGSFCNDVWIIILR